MPKSSPSNPGDPAAVRTTKPSEKPRCNLCGKSRRLTKTPCCGRWICDDEENYQMFSYARNSCFRNHRRYTICSAHHEEGHSGAWQECADCRAQYDAEDYVYFATNEYNFEPLANPPAFTPTRCADCGSLIRRGYEGHSRGPDGFRCEACSDRLMNGLGNSRQEPPTEAAPSSERTLKRKKPRKR